MLLEIFVSASAFALAFGQQVPNRTDCVRFHCTGRDCGLYYNKDGCQVCACPIGSPARGCDPMPNSVIKQLMQSGCPNATTSETKKTWPQRVYRFYRRIDKSKGIDECQSYVFPYCPDVDFNFWRSPRSIKECQEYCYSDEERLILGFIQNQKEQAAREKS